MKRLELKAQLNADHTSTVSQGNARKIQGDEAVRVVLLVPEATEDQSWTALSADQFLAGYSDGDAIYSQLPSR